MSVTENLSQEALKFLSDIITHLKENNAIEDIDMPSLTILAIDYDIFLRTYNEMLSNGFSVVDEKGKANPYLDILKVYQIACLRIMKEYGLTVYSRSHIPAFDHLDITDDPLANFK